MASVDEGPKRQKVENTHVLVWLNWYASMEVDVGSRGEREEGFYSQKSSRRAWNRGGGKNKTRLMGVSITEHKKMLREDNRRAGGPSGALCRACPLGNLQIATAAHYIRVSADWLHHVQPCVNGAR
ncbi:hypothetical protein KM043_011299 [Ampulex compressa]|nr:hypothetical protein KM043_011299 [Ampulex compressa]